MMMMMHSDQALTRRARLERQLAAAKEEAAMSRVVCYRYVVEELQAQRGEMPVLPWR